MCVLKATTQSNRLFYGYLRKFFLFQKDAFCVIVHAGIIWLIFSFYHDLFLFIMFLYVPFIYYLNIWKDVLFFQLNKKFVNKKGLVVETSLDSIYILPYYFSLVHVIYNFYLTKINLSIYFRSISQSIFW